MRFLIMQTKPQNHFGKLFASACRKDVCCQAPMTHSLVAALGLLISMGQSTTHHVQIDPNRTLVESFMGVGVQWDPYEYVPSLEQKRLIEQRVAFAHPGLIRVCVSNRDYFSGYQSGNPLYAWKGKHNPQFDHLCEILAFATKHKIPVMFGEWGPPGEVNLGERRERIEVPDPRWARMFVDLVQYLVEECGYTAIQFLNYVNEPNGSWSGNKDFQSWSTGVSNLAHELEARGLSGKLKIIGPDTTATTKWTEGFEWVERSCKEIPNRIGAYDVHWYAEDDEVHNGLIEPYLHRMRERVLATDPKAKSKRFILGECGLVTGKTNGDQQPRVREFEYGIMVADLVAQVARAGWHTALAWDLDDAMHVNQGPATPIPGPNTLKVWGFWNSWGAAMGKPEEEKPRPWFYAWSLIGRLFPAGTRIISAEGLPSQSMRALAGMNKGRLQLMLINNSGKEANLTVQAGGVPPHAYRLYHYFLNDRPTDGDGFAKPASENVKIDFEKGWQVTLPAEGIAFVEG